MTPAEPPADPRESWNDPALVRRFADRDADVRLSALLDAYPRPATCRVLDLGCAGGRNTELLAARGFDVEALDLAAAMVEATRQRIAPILGAREAERRVRRGEMRALSEFPDGHFDLVVALGIFQQARTETEYYEALAETARVLAEGGLCLVACFAPGTGRVDAPLPRVPGSAFVYVGLHGGRLCLRTPAELEEDLARVGLVPDVPTRIVDKVVEDRRRVTANGLYRKVPGRADGGATPPPS